MTNDYIFIIIKKWSAGSGWGRPNPKSLRRGVPYVWWWFSCCSFSFLEGSLLPVKVWLMVARALDWKRILFSAVFLWLVGSRKMGETRIFLSIQLFSLYYLLKLYRANRGWIIETGRRECVPGEVKRTAYNKLKLTKNVKLFFVLLLGRIFGYNGSHSDWF